MDYKNTLNLPETSFPMKGDLPNKEPILIEKWEKEDIYNEIRIASKDRPVFLLHDGPPYANGDIHLGHAVNKILKDIIIKNRTLSGYNAQYIPGWDCHGMPIEIQIEKKYGKNLPTTELQIKARKYALSQIDKQKKEFKRLGVLGQWDEPYLTMNFQNEADEIAVLSKILEYGYIKRGLKPVNWCFDCGSALAEAEIEYQNKTDIAMYVCFEFANKESIAKKFKLDFIEYGAIVIWTTTPWTIPSNQGLIVNKNVEYSIVRIEKNFHNKSLLIIAKDLVYSCLKKFSLSGHIISSIYGYELEGEEFLHPFHKIHEFYNRISTIYCNDFVNIEDGTGIVHTSPAYGVEDFECYKANGMKDEEIINPIMSNGYFIESFPLFGGLLIWNANTKITEYLQLSNNLLKTENYDHNYMHCWRHKTPIILRATNQWFIKMDIIPSNNNITLRENALNAIKNVDFYPEWGRSRLNNMLSNRPDWTISRQRQWGVPIPFFINKETGELHPDTIKIIERVCKIVEKSGISAWQNINLKDILGHDDNLYEKSLDTLDVWFDSGCSNVTVLGGKYNFYKRSLAWPADLYLEGSDQHRGWFHSSLLIGCMLYGQAPYKALLTHGFVVDGQGKKMSKSIGNVILPKEITNKFGAEILRLWVASTDYSGELYISDEILKRVVESYRRIRNTLRFLLANISDFDSVTNIIATNELLEIDKYALIITNKMQKEVLEDFNKYEFHHAISKLQVFCSEDLGAFFLDILKDRLYTTKQNSIARRSAQTSLLNILLSLLKLMSPILSFTTEEAWQSLLNTTVKNDINYIKSQKTIFSQNYHKIEEIFNSDSIYQKWNKVRSIRKQVQNQLEQLRQIGKIGSSLQAEVIIYANEQDKVLLDSIGDELRFVFIVSKVEIEKSDTNKLQIEINPSNGKKCDRCWNFYHEHTNEDNKTICPRCFINVFGQGEIRKYA